MTPGLLSVAQVAATKGCAPSCVRAACARGELRAAKVGFAWVVEESAAAKWAPRPVGWKKGRPRGSGSTRHSDGSLTDR